MSNSNSIPSITLSCGETVNYYIDNIFGGYSISDDKVVVDTSSCVENVETDGSPLHFGNAGRCSILIHAKNKGSVILTKKANFPSDDIVPQKEIPILCVNVI